MKYIQRDIPVYLVFMMFVLAQSALGGGRIVSWGGHPEGDDFRQQMIQVSAGYMHSLAVTTQGTIVAWGNNDQGQLDVPADENHSIAKVSAGGFHNIGLTTKGKAFGWGLNMDGQAAVPEVFATSCIDVDAGMFHSMLLHKAGFVFTWGYNEFGQTYTPLGLFNVKAISAGAMHSVALRADGTVFVWGDNSFGQTDIPDEVTEGPVAAISAGFFHTIVLMQSGEVYAWGDNTYGQCDVPQGLDDNTIAISAGQSHSMALRSDGTVATWGGAIGDPEAAENTMDVHLSSISAGGYHSVGLIPATSDDNENGIPDWWEMQYSLYESQGAGSDFDKDGFSDLDEYLTDTSPIDDESNFSIQITHGENSECEIVYGPVSIERFYTVEEVSVMGRDNWERTESVSTRALESAGRRMNHVTVQTENESASSYELRVFRVVVSTP